MGLVHNMVFGKPATIYGAEWDGSSTTRLTRTDAAASFADPVPAIGTGSGSSPFDTLQPWAGMEKVADSEAGVLVKIPKFWYKLTKTGDNLKIQIADNYVAGFYVSPAHADRGDGNGERDFVYVGRYHCAENTYKSTTGVKPQVSITRSAARTAIHNLGTTVWQSDFALRFTIWLLYIVEFADWDSQAKIGYGCGNGSVENMGYTDSMIYHTGTTQVNRTTYGQGTQYRWIEGLWDNCYDWLDGCYYNSDGLNIILNPANFSDTTGGTLVGVPSSGTQKVMTISVVDGVQWMYPTESESGSGSGYISDDWGFSPYNPCLYSGGAYYYTGLFYGLFHVRYRSGSYQYLDTGARVMKLP